MNWLRPFQSRAKVLDTLTTKTSALISAINSVWDARGGWFRVTEPYPGAWQENIELSRECVLTSPTLFAVITLIASDFAKVRVKLIQYLEEFYVWEEATSASFSPVLAKPNSYQTRIQFFEFWMLSLLIWGNAYILKRRDARGVVVALYVLDPRRVHVQLATDGSIFYAISQDPLNEIELAVTVPSSEIIHDRMNCLFHPLCGLSPIFACGMQASTNIEIAKNATLFFKNGAKISGILTVPGALPQDKADALKAKFNTGYTGENAGKIAVLADGAKFQPLTMNSTDAQMIEMLKITSEQICSVFHVPGYMVGVGAPPAYNNIEALNQQYYTQCLQIRFESAELLLDEGLSLPDKYSVEFDLDQLLRMDSAARVDAAAKRIGAGYSSPNEERRCDNKRPVAGGESPYLQQQNFSLAALAKRDALPDPFVLDKPTSNPTPSADGPAPVADPSADPNGDAAARDFAVAFLKSIDDGLPLLELNHAEA
jgi:HK97 family phage portal protein